jgi:hypothetical protein
MPVRPYPLRDRGFIFVEVCYTIMKVRRFRQKKKEDHSIVKQK